MAVAAREKIALVAHDNKKSDLFEWVQFNRKLLGQHELYATGTTGTLLAQELDLTINKLESGRGIAGSYSRLFGVQKPRKAAAAG